MVDQVNDKLGCSPYPKDFAGHAFTRLSSTVTWFANPFRQCEHPAGFASQFISYYKLLCRLLNRNVRRSGNDRNEMAALQSGSMPMTQVL